MYFDLRYRNSGANVATNLKTSRNSSLAHTQHIHILLNLQGFSHKAHSFTEINIILSFCCCLWRQQPTHVVICCAQKVIVTRMIASKQSQNMWLCCSAEKVPITRTVATKPTSDSFTVLRKFRLRKGWLPSQDQNTWSFVLLREFKTPLCTSGESSADLRRYYWRLTHDYDSVYSSKQSFPSLCRLVYGDGEVKAVTLECALQSATGLQHTISTLQTNLPVTPAIINVHTDVIVVWAHCANISLFNCATSCLFNPSWCKRNNYDSCRRGAYVSHASNVAAAGSPGDFKFRNVTQS